MSLVPVADAAGAGISELPTLLRRWMTLQDEMSELNSQLKEKRTQGKALKEVILRIMETNNVARLNTSKGEVIHKTREVSEKLTNTYLLKHFKDFFGGDEARAKDLVDYLESHRGSMVKHDLRLHFAKDDDKSSRRS